jgi:hypothetical protein
MASGATNGEIAERLGLSLDGAKWHVREIFSRLGVDSREAAVEWWRSRPKLAFGAPPLAWITAGAAASVAAASVASALWLGMARDANGPVALADGTAQPVPTSTAAPLPPLNIRSTQLRPQPPLKEAASGDGWRLLLADDGLGLPPTADQVLAVGYDQEQPFAEVLGADGRIAARVETGYAPMARINPVSGELLVSDWAEATGVGGRHARLLVFDLASGRLRGEVPFGQARVDFTVPGSAVYVSADGRWFYWIEHATVCPAGGDEAVCDLMVFHAVDLLTLSASSLQAPMPIGCGVPQVVQEGASAILARCLPRAAAATWRIDASVSTGAIAVVNAGAFPSWVGSSAGNSILSVGYTNDGTLTGVTLRDGATLAVIKDWHVADTWSAYLLDERMALLLKADGRLERVDLVSGAGEELPYAIDPGRQGLDILFWR